MEIHQAYCKFFQDTDINNFIPPFDQVSEKVETQIGPKPNKIPKIDNSKKIEIKSTTLRTKIVYQPINQDAPTKCLNSINSKTNNKNSRLRGTCYLCLTKLPKKFKLYQCIKCKFSFHYNCLFKDALTSNFSPANAHYIAWPETDSFRILQSVCKNGDKDLNFNSEPICYSCRRVDEEQIRLQESENNELSSYLSDLERFLDRKTETSTKFLFQVSETENPNPFSFSEKIK